MDEQWAFVFEKSNQRWLCLDKNKHKVGKRNTQNDLFFQARLERTYDIVIGLLNNKLEFSVDIHEKSKV